MTESLWGEEFSLKEDDVKKILNKVKNKKVLEEVPIEKKLKSKSVSIEEKLRLVEEDVNKILGKYKDDVITIRDLDTFKSYIDKSIENGIIAIDTETNNTLDTIDGLLMGLCLYTPEMKSAYIPVNHINRETNELLKNQLTCEQIRNELQRLIDNNVKCIYHNASFDIEVIYSNCDIMLPVYWDTLAGAKLLNENELAGLKAQYRLHIDPDQEKYDIEHLFKGLSYGIFSPELFSLYAATDTLITYRLYEYQLNEFEKPDNKGIYSVLKDIEIPIIPVIVGMELRGVGIDKDYAEKMSIEYHKKLDEIQGRIDEELVNLKPLVDEWKLTPEANLKPKNKAGTGFAKSKVEQLSDPIELGSPTQMAILLYDILNVPVVDKKKPRTTDAATLEVLANEKHVKICSLLLEKREVDILINSFIDKIPTLAKKDGKIHARFNPMGTVTGRFSSSDPNLQQIPSHDKKIRMIFVPDKGNELIGADFGAQEPRSLASFSNDKAMLEAYNENKDLYAVMGTKCYHNSYYQNLEFSEDGKLQPDGKARRSKMKTVLLGIMYGMGPTTLAERINEPIENANRIIEDFYKGFPGVKKFTDESQAMLRSKGYVTDMWGRRRRISDGTLPDFDIKPDKESDEFNPLFDSISHENKSMTLKIKQYQDQLSRVKWKKDADVIITKAKKDGLTVKNNKGFISRALRQCVNARIQGTAASMTKRAMILIDNDEEMKKMNAHLIITVHDEVLMEAPIEYAEQVKDRLSYLMIEAAKEKCICKFKCDGYALKDGWYTDEAAAEIKNNYLKGSTYEELCETYSMFDKNSIKKICEDKFDIEWDSLKYGPDYFR